MSVPAPCIIAAIIRMSGSHPRCNSSGPFECPSPSLGDERGELDTESWRRVSAGSARNVNAECFRGPRYELIAGSLLRGPAVTKLFADGWATSKGQAGAGPVDLFRLR